ncbi:ANF_receptor domain-containing protein [Pseudomonas sp. IT-P2]|uniref:three component ABC system middle component n=1 Tax=Pseudomonas sp. IT-P2 TaxID=3026456 RepID=UPI0039DFC5DD
MIVAHDLYAETNPAFCSYILTTFTSAYEEEKSSSPEMLLCYAALPIALSGDLEKTFLGTNRLTGLLEWLQRNPVVQIDLRERIDSSADIVTEAIQYGCFSKILSINEQGLMSVGPKSTNKSAINRLSSPNLNAFKRARSLGYWMAMAGSTRTTLNMMGLTV